MFKRRNKPAKAESAGTSEKNAAASAQTASTKATEAKSSATAAAASAEDAKKYAELASDGFKIFFSVDEEDGGLNARIKDEEET